MEASRLEWTAALVTGIGEIDEQHQELFRCVARVRDAAFADDGTEIDRTLAFLREYVEFHFQAEERYMAEKRFPDLARHREEHVTMLEAVLEIETDHRRRGNAANPTGPRRAVPVRLAADAHRGHRRGHGAVRPAGPPRLISGSLGIDGRLRRARSAPDARGPRLQPQQALPRAVVAGGKAGGQDRQTSEVHREGPGGGLAGAGRGEGREGEGVARLPGREPGGVAQPGGVPDAALESDREGGAGGGVGASPG